MLRQILAVATHYVSSRRLRHLRDVAAVPALVVSGGRDNLVDPGNSRRLAAALGGELLHYDDAGHGVSEQHAAAVNGALAALWRRGEAKRSARPRGAARAPPMAPDHHPGVLLARALACGWLCSALSRRRPRALRSRRRRLR